MGEPLESQVFGPAAYSPLWVVLGIALLLAAIAWPVLALWLTRPRPAPVAAPAPPPDPVSLRHETLAAIAALRGRHDRGEIDPRTAHQLLSPLVRRFVGAAAGVRAETMTLAELHEAAGSDHRLHELTGFVTDLHPPEFAPSTAGDVRAACDRAEQLVGQWGDPR